MAKTNDEAQVWELTSTGSLSTTYTVLELRDSQVVQRWQDVVRTSSRPGVAGNDYEIIGKRPPPLGKLHLT